MFGRQRAYRGLATGALEACSAVRELVMYSRATGALEVAAAETSITYCRAAGALEPVAADP
ncbi:hypothetical protein EXE45_07600 [Halorubrum sp. SP9]|nr:hypothetical protein EXE45_07600 [Halorubrum sp. SP9]